MPYSDNLYSMVDDDSDLEEYPIDAHQQSQQSFQIGHVSVNVPAHGYGVRQDLPYGDGHRAQIVGGHDEQLYDDDDVETTTADDDVFSPTNGYFRAAPETVQTSAAPSNSSREQIQQAPHVPNVWVRDPSLQPGSTAESKAREADQERQANRNQQRRGILNSDDAEAETTPPGTTTRTYPSSSSSQRASSSAVRGSGFHVHTPYSSQDAYSSYSYPYSYHHQPSASSSTAYGNSSYTSYDRRQPQYYGNFNPRYFPPPLEEAPPAYTPSPTSPSPSSASSSPNYRTFTNNVYRTMGGREETEGLLARDPEDMGGPSSEDYHQTTTSVWRERVRRRLPYLNWRSGKILLGGLVLLLVTVGFLTSLISGFEEGVKPITDPNNPPMDDNKPPTYPPSDDNGFQWRSGYNCQNTKIARPTEQFDVSFSPDRLLTLVQDISSPDRAPYPRHVQVQGEVIFRRSGVNDKPSSAIVLDISVSDERINVETQWNGASQTLVVTVPQNIPWDSNNNQSPNPCVNILATVWVPANATLSNLSVTTAQLGISLLDNLSLTISTNTRLTSTVGPIISASTGLPARDEQIFDLGAPDSYQFHSRIIEAKTTSASIKGSWPLLDYLGLISTSGNIKAIIEPKPVDEDKPAPATLYIKSFSGDVEFREPIHAAQDAFVVAQAWKEAGREAELAGDLHPEAVLPPRDYRVDVHTTSGNIRGSVAFSNAAVFKSTSGNMHVDLLPVLDSSYVNAPGGRSSLSTGSTSGNTVIYVLEPMWVDSVGMRYVPFPGAAQAALRCLASQHSLTSGDMKLHYPAAWEGELSLATNSGTLTAVGDGLEVIKSGKGGPGGLNKYIVAKKGPEGGPSGSRFVAKTTSGDILLTVGN
ncbi:hypothetical protein V8F20_010763 [Naviculisporaceae sp. PSN 640]